MPDISSLIQSSAAHAWLYLPLAVVLGALHALEPGHAKSLMAGYIVAIRGTASQATVLGLSAAVGHTIVVWALATAGLALGEKYIVEQAEPWLTLLSGILIVLLALRMFFVLRRRADHHHAHSHGHSHSHDGQHHHDRHHAPAAGTETTGQIVWFGFTGGLMPCPSAIAVLLVCLQMKAFALGVAMVAAFSVGLAATLVALGVGVAWGSAKLISRWAGFERWAGRLPYVSAGFVLVLGIAISALGLGATGLLGDRRPG